MNAELRTKNYERRPPAAGDLGLDWANLPVSHRVGRVFESPPRRTVQHDRNR